MRKLVRLAVVALAVTAASAVFAQSASASPSKANPCANCHSGTNVPVTATLSANNGTNATYNASAPSGDAIAVFEGPTKRATINANSGQFTVPVGKTYTVFAVRGPDDNTGVGQTNVSPVAPTPDTTAPVTASNALPAYTRVAAIFLSATDNVAGTIRTFYRIDGGSTAEGASILISEPGTHTVEYWSRDAAGNDETPKSATINITAAPGQVQRLAGADRFTVAANMARAGWDPSGTKAYPGVKSIIIANGETGKEADPLAAAGLAGAYDAPVLLVKATAVPSSTKQVVTEIAAKNPGVVIRVVGGTASVPDGIASQLRAIPGVSKTAVRIAGADRYQVTANIAKAMSAVLGSKLKGAYIINSENPAAFYDALAASPGAYAGKYALLGVKAGSVPSSVSQVLSTTFASKPRYVVNSATYVSAGVYSATRATRRFSTTSNRYASAAAIANAIDDVAPVSSTQVGLAAKLPDALTGGVFMGKRAGVMLFTGTTSALNTSASSYINTRSEFIGKGWVLGGTASVPTTQENQFKAILQ